jgi:two-component system NarL family sensor kinase
LILNSNNYHFFNVLIFILSIIFLSGCSNFEKQDSYVITNDSTLVYLTDSKDLSISLNERMDLLSKSYDFNEKNLNDSIKNQRRLEIAFQYYAIGDSVLFMKVNSDANLFYKNKNNYLGLAKSHYYFGQFYNDDESLNNAFYHFNLAKLNYEKVGKKYQTAKMLYAMSVIQKDAKDYTGSEISVIEAISILKKLEKPLYLFYSYNLLGVVFNELEEYNESIISHTNALDITAKIKENKELTQLSLNNLGYVYQKKGDYLKSIEYFNTLLNDQSLINSKRRYARVLDNRAYSKFLLGDTADVFNDYRIALKIRDSLNLVSGIIISKTHLAEYFTYIQDTITAINFLQEASTLATSVNNNRDKLSTLKMLSDLDTKNSKIYLDTYIVLNDSLQIKERKLRNKFTRIRFETDELIEETEILSKRNQIISVVAGTLLLLLGMVVIIVRQRSKNKELVYEKEQQRHNNEFYELQLQQDKKLREGQLKERERISLELHDGILGSLFGARMSLGLIEIEKEEENIAEFKLIKEELTKISKEIREVSHELNNELFDAEQPFIGIIEGHITKQNKIANFKCDFTYDSKIVWNRISREINIHCYRIIQEALQNCNKYAHATEVQINFYLDKNHLILTIIDNGVGFDKSKHRKGIGLKNLQARSTQMNSIFEIKTTVNKGTTLIFKIPI